MGPTFMMANLQSSLGISSYNFIDWRDKDVQTWSSRKGPTLLWMILIIHLGPVTQNGNIHMQTGHFSFLSWALLSQPYILQKSFSDSCRKWERERERIMRTPMFLLLSLTFFSPLLLLQSGAEASTTGKKRQSNFFHHIRFFKCFRYLLLTVA